MHSSKKKKFIKGFTLIELLVVIAIIGVLASIVLASLNSARRKSRDARRITDVKQIQLALELFFDGQGSAYATSSGTCSATPGTGDTENNGLQALANRGYIPQVPRDPLSSAASPSCYSYATPSSGAITTYHLGSSLEDSANPALNGDRDCTSSGVANCVSGITSYSNGFTGPDTAGCGGASGRSCYDVIP